MYYGDHSFLKDPIRLLVTKHGVCYVWLRFAGRNFIDEVVMSNMTSKVVIISNCLSPHDNSEVRLDLYAPKNCIPDFAWSYVCERNRIARYDKDMAEIRGAMRRIIAENPMAVDGWREIETASSVRVGTRNINTGDVKIVSNSLFQPLEGGWYGGVTVTHSMQTAEKHVSAIFLWNTAWASSVEVKGIEFEGIDGLELRTPYEDHSTAISLLGGDIQLPVRFCDRYYKRNESVNFVMPARILNELGSIMDGLVTSINKMDGMKLSGDIRLLLGNVSNFYERGCRDKDLVSCVMYPMNSLFVNERLMP